MIRAGYQRTIFCQFAGDIVHKSSNFLFTADPYYINIDSMNPIEGDPDGGIGYAGDLYRLRLTLVLSQYRAY